MTGFHKTWYEYYAIVGKPNVVFITGYKDVAHVPTKLSIQTSCYNKSVLCIKITKILVPLLQKLMNGRCKLGYSLYNDGKVHRPSKESALHTH